MTHKPNLFESLQKCLAILLPALLNLGTSPALCGGHLARELVLQMDGLLKVALAQDGVDQVFSAITVQVL